MLLKSRINFDEKNHLIWVLRLSTFFVFFGRGIEHIFFDAPFRAILWDQSIMEYFVTTFSNLTWQEYATSAKVNQYIGVLNKVTGILFLFSSVLALCIKPKNIKLSKILVLGSVLLMLLSAIFYKEKFYKIGQLIEYSCQMFSPLFLYIILKFTTLRTNKLFFFIKIAIAFTFLGHGLYALDIYVRPGYWTDMAIGSLRFVGLHFSEFTVNKIIFYAGILDIAVAIGVFLPAKYARPFIIWAAIWGLLTALSRVIGYTNIDPTWNTFFQYLPHTIYRLPHFLIPIAAFLLSYQHKSNTSQSKPTIRWQTN